VGSVDTIQVLYAVFAAACAGILVIMSSTKARLLGFIVIFTMMGGSIITQDSFILPLRGLVGGNMLVSQLLVYVTIGYLLVDLILRFNVPTGMTRLPFEKYFYLLCAWFVVITTYHLMTRSLSIREYKGLMEGMLVVPATYLWMKRRGDEELVELLIKGLIVTAVISSIVAVIQFTVAENFLRVGNARIAFGSKVRSNGIFYAEYTNSYFLIAATVAVLLFVQSKTRRKILVSLFVLGILLSFHRMSWIITVIVFALYLIYVRKQSVVRIASMATVIGAVAFIISSSSTFRRSDLVRSRIEEDTMSDRFKYYTMVVDNANKVFWTGAGTLKSSLYYYGMLGVGQSVEWARGEWGGIHNLYLETLFLYGGPTALLYLILIFSAMKDFHKAIGTHGDALFFPLSFVVMYLIMNLTNSFPLGSDVGFLFGVLIGCGTILASGAPIIQEVAELDAIVDLS
jgi:hypothetical protein